MVDWKCVLLLLVVMHKIYDLPHRYTHHFIGLGPKNKGILINSDKSMFPTKKAKKKVQYFYICKCHIIKYFPKRRGFSCLLCLKFYIFDDLRTFLQPGFRYCSLKIWFLLYYVLHSSARCYRADSFFIITSDPVPLCL